MSQNSAIVTPIVDRNTWDATVEALGGHPLQLWGWGQVKAEHGWQVERLLVTDPAADASVPGAAVPGAAVPEATIGAVEVAYRSLPWPLRSLAYVSRGPVGDPERAGEVLEAVAARHEGPAELDALMRGYGHPPYVFEAGFEDEDPISIHRRFATLLDEVFDHIARIKADKHPAFAVHWLYWHLPTSPLTAMRATPPSHIRRMVG